MKMRRVKYHKYADEACDKADTEIERKLLLGRLYNQLEQKIK